MQLPLADEIRALKKRLARANDALGDLQIIENMRVALGIRADQPWIGSELPGSEWIEPLLARWPELPAPPTHGSAAARLSWCQQIEQFLLPISHDVVPLGEELGHLQHAQTHHMEDRRWAPVVAEITRLGGEQQRVALVLSPTRQRAISLQPMIQVMAGCIERLTDELGARNQPDPHGAVTYRAQMVAARLVAPLHDVAQAVGLTVHLPEAPPEPKAPTPGVGQEIWSVIERLIAELSGILSSLRREHAEVQGKAEALDRELAAISSAIEARTG